VIGEQLSTHRLEAVTKFFGLKVVEGPPEGCPVGDILWLNVFQCFTKGVVTPQAAFEGFDDSPTPTM